MKCIRSTYAYICYINCHYINWNWNKNRSVDFLLPSILKDTSHGMGSNGNIIIIFSSNIGLFIN